MPINTVKSREMTCMLLRAQMKEADPDRREEYGVHARRFKHLTELGERLRKAEQARTAKT